MSRCEMDESKMKENEIVFRYLLIYLFCKGFSWTRKC